MKTLGIIFLGCLGLALLGVSPAHAQAEVQKDVPCLVLNLNSSGNIPLSPMSVFSTGRGILARNPGVNALYQCTAQLAATFSKAVVLDHNSSVVLARFNTGSNGLACTTPMGPTYNWNQVVNPNGKATLTCRVNPSSQAKAK